MLPEAAFYELGGGLSIIEGVKPARKFLVNLLQRLC